MTLHGLTVKRKMGAILVRASTGFSSIASRCSRQRFQKTCSSCKRCAMKRTDREMEAQMPKTVTCVCGKDFKLIKTHGKRKKACTRECYFKQIGSKRG